jgi:hypothetical protein
MKAEAMKGMLQPLESIYFILHCRRLHLCLFTWVLRAAFGVFGALPVSIAVNGVYIFPPARYKISVPVK